jgi:HD-like signal output (HDOD) protein
MSNFTLRDIFLHRQVPTIPAVAKSLFNQLQGPKISFSRFSQTVRFDPGLVCALISKANDKLDRSREVMSVQNAILAVGPTDALQILKEVSTPELIQPGSKYREMVESSWVSCITQAVAAESLQTVGVFDKASVMFLVGLISDIGVLALMQTYPDVYYDQVWSKSRSHKDIQLFETEVFGFSHVTVGHELARSWKLGETFSAAILKHHHEGNGDLYCVTSQCASRMGDIVDFGDVDGNKRNDLNKQLNTYFQLNEDEAGQLLSTAESRRKAIIDSLGLSMKVGPGLAV